MAQIKGLDHCHFWLIISEWTIITKIKNSILDKDNIIHNINQNIDIINKKIRDLEDLNEKIDEYIKNLTEVSNNTEIEKKNRKKK